MKLSIAAAAALPLLASGYTMGGPFGRPVIITNAVGGPCGPAGRCAPGNADQAFETLKKELKSSSSSPRRRRRGMYAEMTKEEAARQRDWLNRAFGLATEAAAAATGVDVKEGNEALRQQQEWLGRAFGVDSSGDTTPRYDVIDSEEAFRVSMDVPGVKQSDIDINLEDNVLTISGERQIGTGEVTRKTTFRKSFTLDSTVEADMITAKLNNGVLSVSAPKNIPVPDVKKIPIIMQVEDDDIVADADVVPEDDNTTDEDDNDAEKGNADDAEKEA